MKKCPLCGASCFDDMDTCYCCMHSFAMEESAAISLMEEDGNPSDPWSLWAGTESAANVENLQEGAAADGVEPDGPTLELVPTGRRARAMLEPEAEVLFGRDECIRIEIPLRLLSGAKLDIPA